MVEACAKMIPIRVIFKSSVVAADAEPHTEYVSVVVHQTTDYVAIMVIQMMNTLKILCISLLLLLKRLLPSPFFSGFS